MVHATCSCFLPSRGSKQKRMPALRASCLLALTSAGRAGRQASNIWENCHLLEHIKFPIMIHWHKTGITTLKFHLHFLMFLINSWQNVFMFVNDNCPPIQIAKKLNNTLLNPPHTLLSTSDPLIHLIKREPSDSFLSHFVSFLLGSSIQFTIYCTTFCVLMVELLKRF